MFFCKHPQSPTYLFKVLQKLGNISRMSRKQFRYKLIEDLVIDEFQSSKTLFKKGHYWKATVRKIEQRHSKFYQKKGYLFK